MSYLNGSNDWDKGNDESLGDVLEEKIEEKAKKEAKKAGGKLTDKISPIKKLKDKIKNVKKTVKNGAKKLAKNGAKGAAKAIAHALKGIGAWIVANPIPSLIILVILIVIICVADIDFGDSTSDYETTFDESDGQSVSNSVLSDDDIVVLLMEDCVSSGGETVSGELNSDKEASAKFIYSIFHSYGFTNASIAGMLANLDTESGLDYSCIETIYDEYGFIGTKKAAAIASISDFTVNTVFPHYEAEGISLNKDGYKVITESGDVSYYCGMGLAQWTGPAAYTLLSAAETINMAWYDMNFQLAFMLSDSLYRNNFFTDWVANQEPSNDVNAARASALHFAHGYEGCSFNDDERQDLAETWFNIISGWDDEQVDDAFVDSITDLATELGGLIDFADISKASYRCKEQTSTFDNSSLANAAVSYAWPTKAQSYNNGTNLYQAVITGIWPGDTNFKACDRVVAGAIRWSGTDDDYPLVTDTQIDYLAASPKWELVGMADTLTESDLQPGDVFILNGHTLLYVGNSAVTAAHADSAEAGSNSVSGSLNERSASCNKDVTNIFNHGGSDRRGTYAVYRCSNPDNSSTYTSIGAGITN